MDYDRVLRDVQCSTIPPGCVHTDLKENAPPRECANYKQAYHSSMQRSSSLVEALHSQRALVRRLSTFPSTKMKLLAALDERKAALDQRECELDWERQILDQSLARAKDREYMLTEDLKSARSLWQQTELQKDSLIRTCGRLLSQHSISHAQVTLLLEDRQCVEKREQEVAKLKKSLAKYAATIKRERLEYTSNLEFSEAERLTLAEANCELETEVNDLRPQLERSRAELQRVSGELTVAMRTISEKDSCIERLKCELKDVSEGGCSSCRESKKDLESMATFLDKCGPGRSGGLVLENLGLQRKLFESQRECERRGKEIESLVAYMKEYKEKSVEKVDILKENICKADSEIRELDDLVERVRQVLRSHLPVLSTCPELLALLNELDGTN